MDDEKSVCPAAAVHGTTGTLILRVNERNWERDR